MYANELAAGGPVLSLRGHRRPLTFVLLTLLSFFALTVVQGQTRAYAITAPPLPVLPAVLPEGLAATAIGVGEVAYFGAAPAVAAAGTVAAGAASAPVLVPVAAAVVAVAATYATQKAIQIGWRWATGHKADYADPPPPSGVTGTWSNVASGYTASGATLTGPSPNKLTFTAANLPGSSSGYSEAQVTRPYNGSYLDYRIKTSDGSLRGAENYTAGTCGSISTCIKISTTNWWGAGSAPPAGATITGYQVIDGNNGKVADFLPSAQTSTTPSGTTTVTTRPTSQCSDGSTVVGYAVTYTGSSTSLPPMVLPACPAGTIRTGASYPSTGAGDATVPAPLAPWSYPTIPTGFPECQVAGSCVLTLLRVGVGGSTESCSDGSCADWQHEFQQQGTARTVKTAQGTDVTERPWTDPEDGARLDCKWGPYLLVTTECRAVPTEPPPAPPEAPPTLDTPPTDTDDGQGGQCYPHGWSAFNPLEWVYKPVRCVMVWAFVPPEGAMSAELDAVGDAFGDTPVGVMGGMVSDVVAPLGGLSSIAAPDCHGPLVTIPLPVGPDLSYYPLNACNELTQMVLGYWMPAASALIYISAVYGSYKALGRTFGINYPLVKAG